MLRAIQTTGRPNGLYAVDPTSTFEAGMIGGLLRVGADIVVTVADGSTIQPIGILDDIKTEAFSAPVVDEVIIIPTAVDVNNLSTVDSMGYLNEVNIVESSFVSDTDVILNAKNGTITVPAGTEVNHSDNGTPAFQVTVSYRYQIADYPGEDTTLGSGQVTFHYERGFYQTDQYDTTVDYPLNANLYCGGGTDETGPIGKFTTRENGPAVAMVVGPPTALIQDLDLFWY